MRTRNRGLVTCDLLVITKKYKEKESTYIITVNSYTILLMRYQEA